MAISLKPVVLGLVVQRPGYGYDLANRLKDRRLPWGAGGVYEALDALEEEGHVVVERMDASSPRRSGRTVYAATDSGRRLHHEWLLQPCDYRWPRQDLDIKLNFCRPTEASRLIEQIAAQLQVCLGELRDLNKDAPQLDDSAGLESLSARVTWDEAGPILMRHAQITQLQARMEYLEEAQALLRRLLERTPRGLS